jgi:hypothetical protein
MTERKNQNVTLCRRFATCYALCWHHRSCLLWYASTFATKVQFLQYPYNSCFHQDSSWSEIHKRLLCNSAACMQCTQTASSELNFSLCLEKRVCKNRKPSLVHKFPLVLSKKKTCGLSLKKKERKYIYSLGPVLFRPVHVVQSHIHSTEKQRPTS